MVYLRVVCWLCWIWLWWCDWLDVKGLCMDCCVLLGWVLLGVFVLLFCVLVVYDGNVWLVML